MWKIIVLCAIVGLAAAQKAVYNNYKVFRMIPTTKTQLEILQQLENGYDGVSKFLLNYILQIQVQIKNIYMELLIKVH